MDLILEHAAPDALHRHAGEVVERKGLGHPDSICDALAEALSVALSRFYLERLGHIEHHNVDKVLLSAGETRPAFGGGEVLRPFEVFLAGRAVLEHRGVTVPVEALAREACDAWFRVHLHALDASRHVRVHTLIRPGSAELVELFARQRDEGRFLANDTSLGVGFAPTSALERATLAVEEALNCDATRRSHPAIGEDVKVMSARHRERVEITLGCAVVDRHVTALEGYLEARSTARSLAEQAAAQVLGEPPRVTVNAADDERAGSLFLTVTGTSAEAGDDGQAGRGNRVSGLITPGRPMTMESVAGKNPVTHVGKLYNVLAGRLAAALVDELEPVSAAHCTVLSRIGHPIDDPPLVKVVLASEHRRHLDGALRSAAHAVVGREVAGVTTLWEGLLAGHYRIA